jgi:hypothetical protein
MTASGQLAWHYTAGENFAAILKSGLILPSRICSDRSGKPAVWLCLNDAWAPSAAMLPPRRRFGLTLKERLSRLHTVVRLGYFRIGVDRSVCSFTWKQGMRGVGLTTYVASNLFQTAGVEQRALPSEWRGTFEPVEREQWRTIDRFESGRWMPCLF